MVSPIDREGNDDESPTCVLQLARKSVGHHRHECGTPSGHKRGNVYGVVIDPRTAKVACYVAAIGCIFSMGDKLFAGPFSAFKYIAGGNESALDDAKGRLTAA